MTDKTKRFSLGIFLAGVALGRDRAKDSSVTVRVCYAPARTVAFPRMIPNMTSDAIVATWAASALRVRYHLDARLNGMRLESLRIGLCEEDQPDEEFVSLYEASQMPRRTGSDEHLPVEWQCDELIARLVRERRNPISLQSLDVV